MSETTVKTSPLRIFGQPKMADTAPPRILVGTSVLPHQQDAPGVDDDGEGRSRHDRILQSRHAAVFAQVRVGAGDGPLHPAVPRTSPRLGAHHPGAAPHRDRGDVAPRSAAGTADAGDQRDRDRVLQRVAGHLARRVPNRCAPGSRDGRRRRGVRDGLSHRHDHDRSPGIFPCRSNAVADGVPHSLDADTRRHRDHFLRARAGPERRATKNSGGSGRAPIRGFLSAGGNPARGDRSCSSSSCTNTPTAWQGA